tara:strand:+ start:170 stop:3088 length:2919 start_codon:yes stop_codon:yes gene_type:complete
MANEFTDIQIIEANRLHSEDASVDNNENFAHWKNNLQDIIHLDAGDKVSVYGAQISELGAGQPTSIEVKGVSLGFTKTFDYISEENLLPDENIPTKYQTIKFNASSAVVDIRDDEMNFNINYYINANGHNYMALPRRWWYNSKVGDISSGSQWGFADGMKDGLSFFRPFMNNFTFYDDYYQIVQDVTDHTAGIKHFKIKNDNRKFTVMVRDATYYTSTSASGNLPAITVRDPENAIYYTYTELKKLKITAGFNSPEFIADELTRQLQNIKETKIYEFRDPNDVIANASKPGFPLRMYETITTETYKPFNVAYAFEANSDDYSGYEEQFDDYYNNNGTFPTEGFAYLAQYSTIATLRPELYETGRLCNRNDDDDYRGIFGTPLRDQWDISDVININQNYNEKNCKRWHELFKAQEQYPEIWNTFSDTRSGYTDGDTIDNSRWMHINRYENASMSFNASAALDGDAMLGYGGYKLHSWNASNDKQPASAILPIYYDPAQRDIFYKIERNASDVITKFLEPEQYTYGCMKCSLEGKIQFTGSNFNGYNSAFYTHLSKGGTVNHRKLGFDMHFTAPGMAYLLPYAGYSTRPDSFDSLVAVSDYYINSGYYVNSSTVYPIGEYNLDSTLYKNKLYIGADVAKVNWNSTNFTLSDLHTGINIGNNNVANNPYNSSNTLNTIGDGQPNTDSSQIAYKINPQEQFNDYTPDRKPYTFIVEGKGPTKPTAMPFNTNLQAWQIYDSLCGIFITDWKLSETEWEGTLMDLLGFTYNQFNNSNQNTRLERIDNSNINNLSIVTTNALVQQSDSKIYVQNMWSTQLFNNMLPTGGTIFDKKVTVSPYNGSNMVTHFPEIIKATSSIQIVAENLPTRMIRGYYTIRSNILQGAPFVGGKQNNTTLPIIGIVNKENAGGDFYFQGETSMEFTITKPMKLSSLTTSVCDPDGSYAKCSKQSTVLFKIQKTRRQTFDIVAEIMANEKKK